MNSTDPLLGANANNGGLTPTNLPLAGSPAIDAVPVANCTDIFGDPLTTDQRGVSRPKGAGCDTGSVELVQASYQICLLYDPSKAARSGSTKPIKFQLCDESGNNLSSSAIAAQAINITQTTTSFSGSVEDSGNANPDSNFRFDPSLGTNGGYIFNLRTSSLQTGTYDLNFIVTGDSFTYSVPFQVK
jgi:hypothetical protein